MSKYVSTGTGKARASFSLFANKDEYITKTQHESKGKTLYYSTYEFKNFVIAKSGTKAERYSVALNKMDQKTALKTFSKDYEFGCRSAEYRALKYKLESIYSAAGRETLRVGFDIDDTNTRVFFFWKSKVKRDIGYKDTKHDVSWTGNVVLLDMTDGKHTKTHTFDFTKRSDMKDKNADHIPLFLQELAVNKSKKGQGRLARQVEADKAEHAKKIKAGKTSEVTSEIAATVNHNADVLNEGLSELIDRVSELESKVSDLESEASDLRASSLEKDREIAELKRKTNRFESSMSDSEIEDDLASLLD